MATDLDNFGEEFKHLNIKHYISTDIIKENNIECSVCLEFNWGIKLPNCNHFICPNCYDKIHNGFISDNFYNTNPYPKPPEIPKEPIYPYLNSIENLKIYNKISKHDFRLKNWFIEIKEWFIEQQQDLYECYKCNDDEYINNSMKTWFETDELIQKYENSLILYDIEQKKYIDDYLLYEKQMDNYKIKKNIERMNNCSKKCPLCRK